jgi:hypothetical protein
VDKVDSSVSPPLYYLKDLMKDKLNGAYYKEQLFKTSAPNYQKNFFEVEKVIATKKYNGKKFYLVKFLYYGSKFNQYIPEENMKFSEDSNIHK